jgi:hypothetical protein
MTFVSLDNATLIEQTARSMRNITYVTEEKKIAPHADLKLIDEFANGLQELFARGYAYEEALSAISDVTKDKGLLDDLLKQIGQDPKWKKFEKIVAGIHMLQFQGAVVKINDHILGKKTGSSRQIDVSIRFTQGFYDYLTIVECKDSTRPVEVGEIEAFSKKMEDVGALHGVMVSQQGFQKGAISSAKFDNIELFKLTEIKSDWTKTIKANVFTLPFPESVEFDYPYFEATPLSEKPLLIKYGDVVFYKNEKDPPVLLTDIIWKTARYVVKKKLPLPQKVRITFSPPLLHQLPTTTFYTPIYAVIINLEPSNFAFEYEIDMPPKLVSYRYSDINEEKVHEFSVKDVPKVDSPSRS